MSMSQQPPRRGMPSIIWPTILIIVGVLFLLANFGFLPPDFWVNIWRLWPLILILIGIEIIVTRAAGWSLLSSIVLVIGILLVIGIAGFFTTVSGGFGARTTTHLDEALANVREAQVRIDFDAGTLNVLALPSGSPNLMEGDFVTAEGREPRKGSRISDGRGVLRLDQRGNGPNFLGGIRQEWSVKLSPQVPIDLNIEAAAVSTNLDLSGLRLSRFDLDIDAASAQVRLPRPTGTVQGSISVDASSIDMDIPQDVEARIRADTSVTSLDIESDRFTRVGDTYVTGGFDRATDRLDLRIRGAASSIDIR